MLGRLPRAQAGQKDKYILYTVSSDLTEIVVSKTSDSPLYDDFINDLPETECRWAVYDFEYQKEEGGKRNKICFYSWYVPCREHDDRMRRVWG